MRNFIRPSDPSDLDTIQTNSQAPAKLTLSALCATVRVANPIAGNEPEVPDLELTNLVPEGLLVDQDIVSLHVAVVHLLAVHLCLTRPQQQKILNSAVV